MAPRSAATLKALATKSRTIKNHVVGAGKFRQTLPAIPWPVMRPIPAEISWIATIKG